MKYTASKWPVAITFEVADDYLDGIDKENLRDTPFTQLEELQKMTDETADALIQAKGWILARQEAKRKQTISHG